MKLTVVERLKLLGYNVKLWQFSDVTYFVVWRETPPIAYQVCGGYQLEELYNKLSYKEVNTCQTCNVQTVNS